MNLNDATSNALRYGVIVSIIVIAIGLAIHWADNGDTILMLGILILILSPLFGIIVSFVCLVSEKNNKWAGVAAVLMAVAAAGILLAFLF